MSFQKITLDSSQKNKSLQKVKMRGIDLIIRRLKVINGPTFSGLKNLGEEKVGKVQIQLWWKNIVIREAIRSVPKVPNNTAL